MKTILDLCGGTGAWSKPYVDAGYNVVNITLPDYSVSTYSPPKNVYGILAAPPCTDFSIARNDKTAKRPRDVRVAMDLVNHCLRIIHECLYEPFRISENSLQFWAIENPYTGYLKRFLGKPALVFQPYEYGDPYTKRTALWGMFNEPKKMVVLPQRRGNHEGTFVQEVEHFKDLKDYQIPLGYQQKTGYSWRKIARSITPPGFAKAFFEANR